MTTVLLQFNDSQNTSVFASKLIRWHPLCDTICWSRWIRLPDPKPSLRRQSLFYSILLGLLGFVPFLFRTGSIMQNKPALLERSSESGFIWFDLTRASTGGHSEAQTRQRVPRSSLTIRTKASDSALSMQDTDDVSLQVKHTSLLFNITLTGEKMQAGVLWCISCKPFRSILLLRWFENFDEDSLHWWVACSWTAILLAIHSGWGSLPINLHRGKSRDNKTQCEGKRAFLGKQNQTAIYCWNHEQPHCQRQRQAIALVHAKITQHLISFLEEDIGGVVVPSDLQTPQEK